MQTLNSRKLKALSLAILMTGMTLGSIALPTIGYAESQSSASETTSQTAEENPLSGLDWHIGPTQENLSDIATIKTSKNEGFLDYQNSDKFLELTGNITTGSTNILVAADDSWWATFDFDPSGYVKDDEKIDADKLLSELKAQDEAANNVRKELGLPNLYTVGWAVPPHYDPTTHLLEWALKVRSDSGGDDTINYTIRLLGRTGVMSATLISDELHLTENIKTFKQSLTSFEFNPGQRYSEFKDGDKVAQYGLAALVAGGAAAIATKKGLWATIAAFFAAAWKFIAVGLVAVGGWISSLFKRRK